MEKRSSGEGVGQTEFSQWPDSSKGLCPFDRWEDRGPESGRALSWLYSADEAESWRVWAGRRPQPLAPPWQDWLWWQGKGSVSPPLLTARAELSRGGSNGVERGLSFRITATPHQGKPMAPVTPARPWPHLFLLTRRFPKRTRLHHEAVEGRSG